MSSYAQGSARGVWYGAPAARVAPGGRRPAERRPEPTDVHEYLKSSAFDNDGNPSNDSHFPKGIPSPHSPWGVSDQYVVADSFRKDPAASDPARGIFRWNVMSEGTAHRQFLGVLGKLGNVISVQVAPFTLPRLPEVPYVLRAPSAALFGLVQNNTAGAGDAPSLVPTAQYPAAALAPGDTVTYPWPFNPYSQTPCGRFTMQLEEPNLQAFSDGPGARHHCEFAVQYTGLLENPTLLSAQPIHGPQSETYNFTAPVIDFPTIGLRFRGPDLPLAFDPDVFYEVAPAVDANGFVRFTQPGHGLQAGDRILVEGFRTAYPALDAYVNRPEGHAAAGDPNAAPLAPGDPITGDDFWTDPAVDASLLVPAPAPVGLVQVYVQKRRLRIVLRFRTVVPQLTNYMQPTAA